MDTGSDEQNVRLPLLEPSALNSEQQRLYERLGDSLLPWAKRSGFKADAHEEGLLGPFNAMLYSPELGAAQLDYLKREQEASCLTARVREVVILTVGAAFDSKYELYAHRAVAVKAGLQAEAIEALATGQQPGPESGLQPEELTAQRFVQAIATRHRVSPEVFAEASKAFGHKGLVDMLHLVGIYMATSSMLNAFDVLVPE